MLVYNYMNRYITIVVALQSSRKSLWDGIFRFYVDNFFCFFSLSTDSTMGKKLKKIHTDKGNR